MNLFSFIYFFLNSFLEDSSACILSVLPPFCSVLSVAESLFVSTLFVLDC